MLVMLFMVRENRPIFMATLTYQDTIQNIQSSVNYNNTSDDSNRSEKAALKNKISKTKNSYADLAIFKSSAIASIQILFSALIPHVVQAALLILFVFEAPIVVVILLLAFIMIFLVKKI